MSPFETVCLAAFVLNIVVQIFEQNFPAVCGWTCAVIMLMR